MKIPSILHAGCVILAAMLYVTTGYGAEIKAEVATWPNRATVKDSIALQFRDAVFYIPKSGLNKAVELGFYYGKNPFQGINFFWIDNASYMKGTYTDWDWNPKEFNRYPFAKTPQEYFERIFFLTDAQGKAVDNDFMEHRKLFVAKDKAYTKYRHGRFQIYRILLADDAAESGPVEMAYIFNADKDDGFIQIVLMSMAPQGQPPHRDKKIFEQILFSLSDKNKW